MDTVFSQWASADPNINQYGYGQLFNQNGEPKVKQVYPGLWANPVITNVLEYTVTRNYQILIYDLVYVAADGSTNQNKVVSDCEEIAFRLVRFLKLKSDLFDINAVPTVTPFYDRWLDDVTGVILDVTITFNGESSDCQDPDYSFNIQNNSI